MRITCSRRLIVSCEFYGHPEVVKLALRHIDLRAEGGGGQIAIICCIHSAPFASAADDKTRSRP